MPEDESIVPSPVTHPQLTPTSAPPVTDHKKTRAGPCSSDEPAISLGPAPACCAVDPGRLDSTAACPALPKKRLNGLKWYVHNVAVRCTCLCSCVGLVAVAGGSGAGTLLLWSGIDLDFGNFMDADGDSSTQWDSFSAALSERKASQGRRLASEEGNETQHVNTKRLTLDLLFGYEMKDGSNLLTEKALHEIQDFEKGMMALPGWSKLCNEVDSLFQPLCSSGVSITNYMFPNASKYDGIRPGQLDFNGKGTSVLPMSIAFAKVSKDATENIMFPKNFKVSDKIASTSLARTLFRFRVFISRSSDGTTASADKKRVKAMQAKFSALFADEIYPVLQETNLESVNVFYDGFGVKAHEILTTLWGDLHFAIGSMLFVFLYMYTHTRSIFLSVTGLSIILLAIPSAYVLFALMSNGAMLTVASFLSLFLTIGLGSDAVFVFTDFWRQSIELGDIESRMVWTYKHSVKATAATTLTTAASFFANLLSVLRPVREFGVLMGLCVTMVFVLLSAFFPQFCLLDERYCKRCCKRCRKQKHIEKTSSGVVAIFFKKHWAWFVGRWRVPCVFLFIGLSIAALVFAVQDAAVSSGMPEMFPEDHNQERGRKVFEDFMPIMEAFDRDAEPASVNSAVCSVKNASDACLFHWCEAQAPPQSAEDTDAQEDKLVCKCMRKPARNSSGTCVSGPEGRGALVRLAGADAEQIDQLPSRLIERLAGSSNWSVTDLGSLVVQNWETGGTEVIPFVEARDTAGRRLQSILDLYKKSPPPQKIPSDDCQVTENCYCGIQRCMHTSDGFVAAEDLVFDSQRRLSDFHIEIKTFPAASLVNQAAGFNSFDALAMSSSGVMSGYRKLQEEATAPRRFKVRSDKRAEVVAVFGIEPKSSRPLLGEFQGEQWSFLGNFDPWQPWAQRYMYKFCTQMPDALMVATRSCWIEGFKNWLTEQQQRFPLQKQDFSEKLREFATTQITGKLLSEDFMWMVDGELKGTYFTFQLDVSKTHDALKTMTLKDQWDAHIKHFEEESASHIKGIWHTSTLWVRAEAENEILGSTLNVLAMSVLLAFLGMLIFTQDILLGVYVVASTVGVIACLAFFMIVIMGWDLGAIEVIALIVFIGYAVTYSLHIAHKYGDASSLFEHTPEMAPSLHAHRVTRQLYDLPTEAKDPQPTQALTKLSGCLGNEESTDALYAAARNVAGAEVPELENPWDDEECSEDFKEFEESPGRERNCNSDQRGPPLSIEDEPANELLVDLQLVNGLGDEQEPSEVFGGPKGAERLERTRFALQSMGGAALGSATTTIGSSFFLLFCTLQVFTKLGSVVIAVTFLSILYALLPLPAMLILGGPLGPGIKPWIARCTRLPSRIWGNFLDWIDWKDLYVPRKDQELMLDQNVSDHYVTCVPVSPGNDSGAGAFPDLNKVSGDDSGALDSSDLKKVSDEVTFCVQSVPSRGMSQPIDSMQHPIAGA